MARKTEKELLIRVKADIEKALTDLKRASDGIGTVGKKAKSTATDTRALSRANDDLSTSSGLLAGAMKRVAAAFGAYKLSGIVKDSALLAAGNETLGVVLGVVGRNAGISKGALEGHVEQVKALGITTKVANQAVIRMTQLQLDLTKATELARVAQDAAVVGQTNSSEALQRLINGIVTLQPEVLRTIGINISFEREYARVAKQLDRTVDSLGDTEKQQIAMNAVISKGATLAGSYEEAMGTVGKQMTSIPRLAETAAEELGKLFQGPLGFAISSISTLLSQATENLMAWNLTLGISDADSFSLAQVDGQIKAVNKTINELKSDIEEGDFGLLFVKSLRLPQLEYNLRQLKKIRDEIIKDDTVPVVDNSFEKSLDKAQQESEALAEATAKLNKQSDSLTEKLEQQTALLGLNAEESIKYRLSLGDLAGTEKEIADALILSARAFDEKKAAFARAKEEARNAGADNQLLADLATEISLLGAGARQQEIAAAAARLSKDATEEQRQAVEALAGALLDANQAAQEYEDTMQAGQRVIDSTRTANERFAAQLTELNRLYEEGALGAVGSAEAIDVLQRASDQATEQFEDMKKKGTDTFRELTNATRGWSRDFADQLLDGELNFENLVSSMLRQIARIGLATAFDPFFAGVGEAFQGLFTEKADGGMITGPGTATSDSIPALLSNGEYVVKASAVQHYGQQFMEEINAIRRPRFAIGGMVRGFSAPAPLRMAGGGKVQAPHGGGSVSVSIDNKGTPSEVVNADVEFDGRDIIISIFLDDADNGGPMIDKISSVFNLQRSGG